MAQATKEPCKKEACDIQACLTKNNFLPQKYALLCEKFMVFFFFFFFWEIKELSCFDNWVFVPNL